MRLAECRLTDDERSESRFVIEQNVWKGSRVGSCSDRAGSAQARAPAETLVRTGVAVGGSVPAALRADAGAGKAGAAAIAH
jgi:hypothetical protein